MYLEVWFMVGISFVIIMSFSRIRSMNDKQSEQLKRGLLLLTHIQKIMAFSQQHRGVSNAILQGNNSLKTRLISLQREVDQLIAEGTALNLVEFEQWKSFSEHWPRLKLHCLERNLEPKNLIRQHNIMIDGHLSLLDDIILFYKLSSLKLDDITHVSALCIDVLRVVEKIAQVRGLGSGVCAKEKCIGVDQISLNFLKISISVATNELLNDLNLIENTELSDQFLSSSVKVKSGVENLVNALDKQILVDEKTSITATDYFNLATKPIDDLIDIFHTVINYSTLQFSRET